MATKGHPVHNAEAAMLGYLTGLSAAVCRAWIEAPVVKSAEALKAAFRPDCDEHSILAARSEIEAYALVLARQPNSNPWQFANYIRYGRD